MRLHVMLVSLACLAAPGAAEVVSSSPASFEVNQVMTVDASLEQTWDAVRAPARWWSAEHTYSGDSANLYMDTQATGCFCERLKGKGSIEHAHIVYIQPPREIRMRGALGPLQAEAVTGTFTIKLDSEGGNATRVTMNYIVGGYVRVGADTIAPKVDEVLALQMVNLKAAAEAPPPPDPADTK